MFPLCRLPARVAKPRWSSNLPRAFHESRPDNLLRLRKHVPANSYRLAIPDSLDGILRAFPNVTVLACPALLVNSKLLAPAKTHYPRLKALAGLRIYKVRDYQNLIPGPYISVSAARAILTPHSPLPRVPALGCPIRGECVPAQVRGAQFFAYTLCFPLIREQDLLTCLYAFKHLRQLELVYQVSSNFLSLEALITGGRDVLCASQSPDVKVLKVWRYEAYVGPHIVHSERW
jgi:hypothetical protein